MSKSLRQKQIDEVLGYHDNINRDTFEREKKFVFISGQQESPPTKDDLVVEASIREFTQAINYDLQNIAQAVNYIPSTFALQILRDVYEEEENPPSDQNIFEPRGSRPRGTFGVGEEKPFRAVPQSGEFQPVDDEKYDESEEEGENKSVDPREEAYLNKPNEAKLDYALFRDRTNPTRTRNPEYAKQMIDKRLEREKSSRDTFEKISLFLTKLIRDWNNLADFVNIKLRQLTVKNITTFMMPIKALLEPIKDVLARIVVLRTQTPEYYKIYNTLTMLYDTINETEQIPIKKLDPREINSVPATEGDATRVSFDQFEMAASRLKEYGLIINDLRAIDYTTPQELKNGERLLNWYVDQSQKLKNLADAYSKIPPSKAFESRKKSASQSLVGLFRVQDQFRDRYLKKYPESETARYLRMHPVMQNPSLATISDTHSQMSRSERSVGSEYSDYSSLDSYRPGNEYRQSRRSEPSQVRFPSGYSRVQEEDHYRRMGQQAAEEGSPSVSPREHVTSSEEEDDNEGVDEAKEIEWYEPVSREIKGLVMTGDKRSYPRLKSKINSAFSLKRITSGTKNDLLEMLEKYESERKRKQGSGKPKKGGNDNFQDEASLAPYLTKHLKPSKFQGVPIIDEVNVESSPSGSLRESSPSGLLRESSPQVTGGRKKRVKHRKPLVDNHADEDMWFL
jgi:hypothetical protein